MVGAIGVYTVSVLVRVVLVLNEEYVPVIILYQNMVENLVQEMFMKTHPAITAHVKVSV